MALRPRFTVLMVGLAFVTVLIGGVPVAASLPPRIEAGAVLVPVDPIVRDLAQEVTIDREHGTVSIRRGDRSIVVRVKGNSPDAFGDAIYVPLAAVVRALGGTVRFDAVRKVAEVEMPAPGPIVSPTPYDSANPTVAPRKIFTPQPIATPRPALSGRPQPRRTPIPVMPSYPVPDEK